METIGNESKAKRFGKAAIDIVSFAALAVIIITIISVPFATVLLELGKEEADTMSYFILSETLMLAGVFLSAWIVWHLRGFSLEGLGRSFTMRWKDWLSGILLATVLYAVGFGISLWCGRDCRSGIQSFFLTDQPCILPAGSRNRGTGIAGICIGTPAAKRGE